MASGNSAARAADPAPAPANAAAPVAPQLNPTFVAMRAADLVAHLSHFRRTQDFVDAALVFEDRDRRLHEAEALVRAGREREEKLREDLRDRARRLAEAQALVRAGRQREEKLNEDLKERARRLAEAQALVSARVKRAQKLQEEIRVGREREEKLREDTREREEKLREDLRERERRLAEAEELVRAGGEREEMLLEGTRERERWLAKAEAEAHASRQRVDELYEAISERERRIAAAEELARERAERAGKLLEEIGGEHVEKATEEIRARERSALEAVEQIRRAAAETEAQIRRAAAETEAALRGKIRALQRGAAALLSSGIIISEPGENGVPQQPAAAAGRRQGTPEPVPLEIIAAAASDHAAVAQTIMSAGGNVHCDDDVAEKTARPGALWSRPAPHLRSAPPQVPDVAVVDGDEAQGDQQQVSGNVISAGVTATGRRRKVCEEVAQGEDVAESLLRRRSQGEPAARATKKARRHKGKGMTCFQNEVFKALKKKEELLKNKKDEERLAKEAAAAASKQLHCRCRLSAPSVCSKSAAVDDEASDDNSQN